MLNVDQALQLVLENALPLTAATVPLADSLGLVLAEDVASDIDSPPHDKSIVDGYALIASECGTSLRDVNDRAYFEILEEVVAGDVPQDTIVPGAATRIMTGAPIPSGADAVVMVERTELLPGGKTSLGRVAIRDANVVAGQNIMRQGAAMRRGDIVLTAGSRLRAAEIGLLAEVGRSEILAIRRPRVAVLSTGNELVPAAEVPGPGKIRNSNGPMLLAMIAQAGAEGIDLGIGRDDRESLHTLIAQGLQADVLVLSGGVSAGVLDLVPPVLEELGVQQVFHKLRLKPGKPLWFGVLSGR